MVPALINIYVDIKQTDTFLLHASCCTSKVHINDNLTKLGSHNTPVRYKTCTDVVSWDFKNIYFT